MFQASTDDRLRALHFDQPPADLEAVNAARDWTSELSVRAGLADPNDASRHKILATEPLNPFLDSALFSNGHFLTPAADRPVEGLQLG